ncbi:MAG: Regulatory protein RecX [Microgenomates group bacterium GW2011_GWA2_37_6]|nr:MAG: Regulatory protein RecX [Microgenomates group bacterium GW2011_GWA2_37_6]
MDSATIIDRYYNLSLRFLSYRPRSKKEVLDYLKKKATKSPSLTEEIIAQIIEKLKSYKFIDDADFAKFWIEQRIKFKHKPMRVIEFELKQKGIDREIIDEILSRFDERKDLDLGSAKKLAEKKLDFYRGLDSKKRQEKVMGYLLRKGFNYEIVKKVLLDLPRSLEE